MIVADTNEMKVRWNTLARSKSQRKTSEVTEYGVTEGRCNVFNTSLRPNGFCFVTHHQIVVLNINKQITQSKCTYCFHVQNNALFGIYNMKFKTYLFKVSILDGEGLWLIDWLIEGGLRVAYVVCYLNVNRLTFECYPGGDINVQPIASLIVARHVTLFGPTTSLNLLIDINELWP